MGSRVVGFRVPEDLATEVEGKAAELGQTMGEFLRKLVDDALYPSKGGEPATLEDVTKVELQTEVNEINEDVSKLTESFNELTGRQDKDTQAILQVTTRLSDKFEIQRNGLLSIIKTVDENIAVYNKRFADVEKIIEGLTKGLSEVRTKLTTHGHDDLKPIPELVAKVGNLERALGTMQSKVEYLANAAKRQPTGDIVKLTLTDEKEHLFRSYKSGLGLTRPHHVDVFLGDGYWVDLSEPDK